MGIYWAQSSDRSTDDGISYNFKGDIPIILPIAFVIESLEIFGFYLLFIYFAAVDIW